MPRNDSPSPPNPALEQALIYQLQGWLTGRPSAALDALSDAPPAPASAWLWAETPPLIQQMMARAVLRWLVEEGGWRVQPYPDEDQIRQGRLWESVPFRTLTMRFSAAGPAITAALTAALAAAQHAARTAPAQPPPKKQRKPTPAEDALATLRRALTRRAPDATPAEQLALTLTARALLRQSIPGVSPSQPLAADLIASLPLPRLLLAPASPSPSLDPLPTRADAQAWADAWGWTSPWLADAWASPWVAADATALTLGLSHFRHVIGQLSASLNHLVDVALAAERHAWLLPALSFFRRAYAADPSPRLAALTTLTHGQRVSDRQAVQDAWGALLRALGRIDQARASLQRTLPADREPHARALLTAWQAHDMTATADRVQTLRAALERVLG